jgi:hypothetical protein
MYKPSRIHVVAYALSRLPNITKPIKVVDQSTNASLFYTELKSLNDVNYFLEIG